jgi:hypothetical protein
MVQKTEQMLCMSKPSLLPLVGFYRRPVIKVTVFELL